MLAGDLGTARADLTEAFALHTEMGADTGAAHTLQRLAEVELAAGDRSAAERLLRRALPLARWSPLARHLLQRIYGTLISAAPEFWPASSGYHDHRRDTGAATLGVSLERSWRKHG